jgi:hypothetical protein
MPQKPKYTKSGDPVNDEARWEYITDTMEQKNLESSLRKKLEDEGITNFQLSYNSGTDSWVVIAKTSANQVYTPPTLKKLVLKVVEKAQRKLDQRKLDQIMPFATDKQFGAIFRLKKG